MVSPALTSSASSSSSSSMPNWLASWSPFSRTKLPDNLVASEVSAVEDPVHVNQRVEKCFTIFAPPPQDPADTSGVQAVREHTPRILGVRSPGLTVVRVLPQLVDEAGPDVIARVRVSSDTKEHLDRLTINLSDKRALTLNYNHANRGAQGHLVTEIDVPRESDIHHVVAMGGGDVVVHDGVLGRATSIRSERPTTPLVASTDALVPGALLSMHGSRLFLLAPHRELRFHSLVLGAMGTSSIHIEAKSLEVTQDVLAGVLGRGGIDVHTQSLRTPVANIAAVGGGDVVVTAERAFHASSIGALVRGDGSVHVTTPPYAVVDASLSQEIRVSHGGTVDLADVPSVATKIALARPAEGIVRIRAPHETLAIDCPRSGSDSAAVHHIGALPDEVQRTNAHSVLTEVDGYSLVGARADWEDRADWRSALPTIEAAFETPVALEKPSEGWVGPVIAPTVRCFLPF